MTAIPHICAHCGLPVKSPTWLEHNPYHWGCARRLAPQLFLGPVFLTKQMVIEIVRQELDRAAHA